MPVKLKSPAWSPHTTLDWLISHLSFTFSLPKDTPNSARPKTQACSFPQTWTSLKVHLMNRERAPGILETRLAPFQVDTFPCAIHHESLLELLPQCLSNSSFLLLHLRSPTRALKLPPKHPSHIGSYPTDMSGKHSLTSDPAKSPSVCTVILPKCPLCTILCVITCFIAHLLH